MGFHLSERARFPRAPRLAGVVEHDRGGERSTLAVLHEQVPHQTTGWNQALGEVSRFYERAAGVTATPPAGTLHVTPGGAHASGVAVPDPIADRFEWYVEALARLGRRTADLHAALATPHGDEAFEPEPIAASEFEAEMAAIGQRAAATLETLRGRAASLPEEAARLATQVLAAESNVRALLAQAVSALPAGLLRTRIHGDYQLGQALWNEGDVFLIDFEGDPARSIAERRAKQSPLRDIATMARSLSYAAYVQLSAVASASPTRLGAWDRGPPSGIDRRRISSCRAIARRQATRRSCRTPARRSTRVLRAYLLDESVTELAFELESRPNLAFVPLESLRDDYSASSDGRPLSRCASRVHGRESADYTDSADPLSHAWQATLRPTPAANAAGPGRQHGPKGESQTVRTDSRPPAVLSSVRRLRRRSADSCQFPEIPESRNPGVFEGRFAARLASA